MATSRFRIRPAVVMLAVVTAISAFPLYFMVVMASRPNEDITSVPPPLWPGDRLMDNVDRVLSNPDVTFEQALVNSVVVSLVCTVSVVFFSCLAGFAFAKLRFVGRHGVSDMGHTKDLSDQIEAHVHGDDMADVCHVADVVADLYVRMFREIGGERAEWR